MNPVESHVLVAAEPLRLGACLAHSMPSATALLATTTGDRLLVAHHRRDATLDPCQLRAAIGAPWHPGVPHFADVVASIELVGGLVDIGGGLYRRSHPAGPDERWFATPLTAERIVATVGTSPLELPEGSVEVRVWADSMLCACAVSLSAGPGFGYRLDEAALWLHAACLVDELIESATSGGSTRT